MPRGQVMTTDDWCKNDAHGNGTTFDGVSARFPSNFRFELTEKERDEVVANCDHLQSLKFRPTLPYAFTEQGIGQLSSVVHSQQAIERSIVIMNAFVAMRRFIVQNAGILMRLAHLERHQIKTPFYVNVMNEGIKIWTGWQRTVPRHTRVTLMLDSVWYFFPFYLFD
jgi:hypothetical protein